MHVLQMDGLYHVTQTCQGDSYTIALYIQTEAVMCDADRPFRPLELLKNDYVNAGILRTRLFFWHCFCLICKYK